MDDWGAKKMLLFQRGDPDAFQELFERYKKPVINFCYRFCRDWFVAEELAQEVFIRVYRAASGYKKKARFVTWLYRIATNVCLNASRKKGLDFVSIDEPVDCGSGEINREVVDTGPGLDEKAGLRAEIRLVEQGMMKLPAKQRLALLLRIVEGFSYEEIAIQLGCPKNTAKTLVRRGRLALAKYLAQTEDGGDG